MDNQKLNISPRRGYGFVYCYTSPSGKKYIGQTKTTLKKRAKTKNAKGYKGCSAFYNAIQKYGWDNFEVEILCEVPLDVLNETEIQYILYYDTINKEKGYNIMTDRIDYLASLNRVRIFSYDGVSGNFIESFESIFDAERFVGVHYGSIRRIVNLPNHQVKGRVWLTEKKDRIDIPEKKKQPHGKKIQMFDVITGELVDEFSSIREAARKTGYNRNSIQNQISRGIVKNPKKHFFKVVDESSTTIPSEVGGNAQRKTA